LRPAPPENAVLGTLSGGGGGPAGGAIEVATSRDGRYAFVSLEHSAKIAVFNLKQALASHFRTSGFAGDVPAGIAPVGLALVDSGQRVVVADSNRFSRRGARSNLAVVNAAAALAHRPALAGYLPAAGFPRQMALEPDGRVLLVTNFASRQLETVNVTNLP
jgi:6-phosphogluconolactonase (cycloisomerase 2 family)